MKKIKKFENMGYDSELKMVKREAYFLDYNDLDIWINKIYPFLNFDFTADCEANNHSCYKFEAKKLKYDFDIIDYREFKKGVRPRFFNVHKLFDYLVEDGYLEPATYIVEVYW